MSKRLYNHEDGMISIDAVLSITVFMITIIAIMMISSFARIQSSMQYALGQTAKEMSGYFYMLDKIGLTKVMSGNTKGAENVDQAINDVITFSQNSEDLKHDAESLKSGLIDLHDPQNIDIDSLMKIKEKTEKTEQDVETLSKTAQQLAGDFKTLSDNPIEQLKGVLSVFAKTMINGGVTYFVVPRVCRVLMPHYLGGDQNKANEKLKAMGIENGLQGLDFSQSEVLSDGRSIKLVVMYRVNPDNLTLGFIKLPGKKGIPMRQVACTAAWLKPDGLNTITVAATKNK